MIKLCTLYSGSSGNATLVSDGKTNILIDMGKNNKQTLLSLGQLGMTGEDIDAVLVTHEHIDHIKGIKVFTKHRETPIYSLQKCLEYMENKEMVSFSCKLKEVDIDGFYIGDFFINPFLTEHDSHASCGFSVHNGNKKIALATDLGIMTSSVLSVLKDADAVVLESNYDKNMLAVGPYPYYLKKRIACETGHLSNEACAQTVIELARSGVKQVLLAHLSKENNYPYLAKATTESALEEAGATGEIEVDVCPRDSLSKLVTV